MTVHAFFFARAATAGARASSARAARPDDVAGERGPTPEAARAPTPEARRKEETARLAAAIPPRATLVVLDGGGAAWSSEELARRLESWRVAAAPVALAIGGAFGLEPDFIAAAPFRWSLGTLTLPHELARVVVMEQWYRAWTILRGEPYHK